MYVPPSTIARRFTWLFGILTAAVLAGTPCFLAGCSCAQTGGEPGGASASEVSQSTQAHDAHAQLNAVVEDGEPLSDDVKNLLSEGTASKTTEPCAALQYPELESGCEIAALASALQTLGFNVTPTEIADEYLVVDGEYDTGYLASPYTDYGGGFPPGIVKTANAYLKANNSNLRAHDLTGTGFGGVTALADAGYPVLVWTTLENSAPNYDPELGGIGDWYVNEHCITVYDVSDGIATVADPLKGLVEMNATELASVYTQCGNRALYIR